MRERRFKNKRGIGKSKGRRFPLRLNFPLRLRGDRGMRGRRGSKIKKGRRKKKTKTRVFQVRFRMDFYFGCFRVFSDSTDFSGFRYFPKN